MKELTDCYKIHIGHSDKGYLLFVGVHQIGYFDSRVITFEKDRDGNYMAYLVERDDVVIPDDFEKIVHFRDWMKIFDDDGLVQMFYADHINIYRSGPTDCIVEVIHNRQENENVPQYSYTYADAAR